MSSSSTGDSSSSNNNTNSSSSSSSPPPIMTADQALAGSSTIAVPTPPRPIAGADGASPLAVYMNSLNAKYQERIKRLAQVSNPTIHLRWDDGKEEEIQYTRMKLLQWQFDELEDLRAAANDMANSETGPSARESHRALQNMYKKAATYLLFNTKTEKAMTDDEYKHCYFPEIRPVLDAAMLLSLVSDPN